MITLKWIIYAVPNQKTRNFRKEKFSVNSKKYRSFETHYGQSDFISRHLL